MFRDDKRHKIRRKTLLLIVNVLGSLTGVTLAVMTGISTYQTNQQLIQKDAEEKLLRLPQYLHKKKSVNSKIVVNEFTGIALYKLESAGKLSWIEARKEYCRSFHCLPIVEVYEPMPDDYISCDSNDFIVSTAFIIKDKVTGKLVSVLSSCSNFIELDVKLTKIFIDDLLNSDHQGTQMGAIYLLSEIYILHREKIAVNLSSASKLSQRFYSQLTLCFTFSLLSLACLLLAILYVRYLKKFESNNVLTCYFPEEVNAELMAVHDRLVQKNTPASQIRRIISYQVMTLLLAFFYINIENLWLPRGNRKPRNRK
jgi:hypothetical protein